MKKYSYLPGFVLLVAGFIHASYMLTWTQLDVILCVAGAGVVLVSLGLNWTEIGAWFREPGGVFAINTAVSCLVLIGILVLANFLARQHPLSADLTASGRNTLSAGTRDFVLTIPRNVTIQQFGRQRNPEIDHLLASFAEANSRIRVGFADIDRQQREARGYGITKPNGTVIVTTEFKSADGRYGVRFRKVEDVNELSIVTALVQLLSNKQSTVCFVTGHGEHGLLDDGAAGLSKLATVLEVSNLRVERLSLFDGDVPAACSVVVLAGPRQELQQAEIDRLALYLRSGGGLAVMLDPGAPQGLTNWLRSWGVLAPAGTVLDTSTSSQTVGAPPDAVLIAAYGRHPVTAGFEVTTMFGRACPLDIGPSENGGRPAVLAQTGQRSYVKPSADGSTIDFEPGKDRRGPITVAVVNEAGVPVSIPPGVRRSDRARLVVLGDSDFVSNGYLFLWANRDLFLRTVSWLTGEGSATIVNVSQRDARRITLTQAMKVSMFIVNLIVLPLVPLIAGIVVFVRSKR